MATSRCNGIWVMARHNRHNGLLPLPACYGLVVYVADLLQICYGETNVMDFGKICYGEIANLLRTCWQHDELCWHVKIVCCVVNKSATSWQQVVVMEFGNRHETQWTFAHVMDLLREATGKLV